VVDKGRSAGKQEELLEVADDDEGERGGQLDRVEGDRTVDARHEAADAHVAPVACAVLAAESLLHAVADNDIRHEGDREEDACGDGGVVERHGDGREGLLAALSLRIAHQVRRHDRANRSRDHREDDEHIPDPLWRITVGLVVAVWYCKQRAGNENTDNDEDGE